MNCLPLHPLFVQFGGIDLQPKIEGTYFNQKSNKKIMTEKREPGRQRIVCAHMHVCQCLHIKHLFVHLVVVGNVHENDSVRGCEVDALPSRTCGEEEYEYGLRASARACE